MVYWVCFVVFSVRYFYARQENQMDRTFEFVQSKRERLMRLSWMVLLLCSINVFAQQESKQEKFRAARSGVRSGNDAYNQSNFSEAEVSYRKAISKKENYAKAKYNLGNALFKQQRSKEALEQYETLSTAFEDKKDQANVFHNLGNAYLQEKDLEKAVGAYQESLKNNPKDEETRYNLALAQKLLEIQQQQQKQENKEEQEKDKSEEKEEKDKKDNQQKEQEKEKENQKKEKDQNKEKEDQKDQKEQEKQEKSAAKDEENNKQQQPKEGQLSKEQLAQLLEALNNEENKTQKKLNEKRAVGARSKREKDW
jgi:tetratricopeptide (TPR) repeat protein